jgi:hypothetical protein
MPIGRKIVQKLLLCLVLSIVAASGCTQQTTPEQTVTRAEAISDDAIKMLPEADSYPPFLHAIDFQEPVPLPELINTAGAEDSPFIPEGRKELYFFFTPDPTIDPSQQLLDGVTGIWMSRWEEGQWQEPERVWLQEKGKLALDGCTFVSGDRMYFCSAREGYVDVHWFTANCVDGEWRKWVNADFPSEFGVGELHIWEDELYYHSSRDGGEGENDIWMLKRENGEWRESVNVAAVNREADEGMPFLTSDGQELWFNRFYQGSPAVFRSKRVGGEWQEPEMIVSQFAGEPTLDWQGNLYFVHHYYEQGKMIEADIYVAYRK